MAHTTHSLWCLFPTKKGDDAEHADCDVVRHVQVLVKEPFLCQQLFHAETLYIESIKQSLDSWQRVVSCASSARVMASRVCCVYSSSAKAVLVLDDLAREINTRRKRRSFCGAKTRCRAT